MNYCQKCETKHPAGTFFFFLSEVMENTDPIEWDMIKDTSFLQRLVDGHKKS